MRDSDIGIIGLGVMGRNLALNLEECGNRVSVYNRYVPGEEEVVSRFIAGEGKGKDFFGTGSIPDFVASLKTPRKILLLVTAGKPVDDVIEQLLPCLQAGDIVIDSGNSHYKDTERRVDALASDGILFVGMGISGGEEGARNGPSLMPGGNPDAWEEIRPILEPAAARSFDDSPCCAWIGKGGAGHFVKMAHNGIEYAEMQIIAEAYHLMKTGLGMHSLEISNQFKKWNRGSLASYLFEITSDIFAFEDDDRQPLVEKILDSAGQKGTGKWTAIAALEIGIPLSGISEAVFSRFVSSLIELRKLISEGPAIPDDRTGPGLAISTEREAVLSDLADSLRASRMMCHAEGFFFITRTGKKNNWNIDPVSVARIWQGGCIIRSELLKEIEQIYEDRPTLPHLLLSRTFTSRLDERQAGWRRLLILAISHRIPVPVMSITLSQYDSMRFARLPANLIQAQRDYFGAHTYERLDSPRGDFFHTDWNRPNR